MSQWNSEYAILQDLSLAQGRVPAAIEGTLRATDKPPSLNITEETGEEFFNHSSTDVDVSAAPDLRLIKKMLDMVRDVNLSPDEEDFTNKAIVISKLNHPSSNFVPKTSDTSTPMCQSPVIKKDKIKKSQRNIALESIIQAISDGKKNENVHVVPEPIKLLKPNDFISKMDLAEENTKKTGCVQSNKSVKTAFIKNEPKTVAEVIKDFKDTNNVSPTINEKVNGWFNTQMERPFPKRVPKVTLEATHMTSIFKRKTVTEKVHKVEMVKSPTSWSGGEYKPSTQANKYYQKYVEQSKFKESVKDDMWSMAEKKMKEIDDMKRREGTLSLSPSTTIQNGNQSIEDAQSSISSTLPALPFTTFDKVNHCINLISLPQHRHLLTGECIVCKVMMKKPTVNEEVKYTELNVTGCDQTTEDDDKCVEGNIFDDKFLLITL